VSAALEQACWLAPELLAVLVAHRAVALMGADGQGRWLIAVEGAGGELDDLRLAIGERRHALLTAPARDALVTPVR
jgi:hypothetical protein